MHCIVCIWAIFEIYIMCALPAFYCAETGIHHTRKLIYINHGKYIE